MISLGRSRRACVAHHVVVDPAGGGVDPVVGRLPDRPAVIDRRAVGQVPAVRQRHAHAASRPAAARAMNAAKLAWAPGVGLHIGVVGAEELLRPGRWPAARPGPRLRSRRSTACPGYPSAYLLVSGVPIASMHRAAGEVLAGDELQPVLLAVQLRGRSAGRRPGRRARSGALWSRLMPCVLVRFWPPGGVAPALERRLQPGRRMSTPSAVGQEPGRQHQDVGVVVRPGQPRDLRRPGHRRPDARGGGWRRTPCPARCRRAALPRGPRRAPPARPRGGHSPDSRPRPALSVPRSSGCVPQRRTARDRAAAFSAKPAWSAPMGMTSGMAPI